MHLCCSHYSNIPSAEPRSVPEPRLASMEASPAPTYPASSQQRTPMSYELPSPMSNASSYMNKNSVDPQGTNSPLPEAHSLVTTIMLSDSILNLFKVQLRSLKLIVVLKYMFVICKNTISYAQAGKTFCINCYVGNFDKSSTNISTIKANVIEPYVKLHQVSS